MKFHLTYKSIWRYVLILLIGAALVLFSDYLGLFQGIDVYLYDLSFRIRGSLAPDGRILIVAIDEKSLESLGRWPIRRKYFAQMLSSAQNAKVVGVDIIMAEPSGDDDALNETIKGHGGVVLPVYIDSMMNVSSPAHAISSARIGHIHIEQGIDGVVRTVFHRLHIRDTVIPSFASALLAPLGDMSQSHREREARSVTNSSFGTIVQSDPMHINFAGPSGTFPTVSLVDVIHGRYPHGFFDGKIVLLGVTAAGIEERMLTPFAQDRNRMAGVEVHANILNSMIANNAIVFMRDGARWTLYLIVSLLCFFLFTKFKAGKAAFLWMASLAVAAVAMFLLFSVKQVWAAPSVLFFLLTFMFLTAHVVKIEEMGRLLAVANDEWYRTFNDISDAIVVYDGDFNIVRANEAAETIRATYFFEQIAVKSREQLRGFNPRKSSAIQQLAAGSHLMEIFDTERNRHLEVLTIPRRDTMQKMTGVIQIIRDITERKQSEEAIRKNEEQLRNLTAYIHKVTEIERTNIAREIHDELGQALTVLKIDLSWIRKRLTQDQAPMIDRIDAMVRIIDKTIMAVKKISSDLRPGLLDDLGLSAAIEWQSEEFEKRTGILCSVRIEPKDVSFDKDRNTALFRILQEALTNIARHSDATEVEITLQARHGHIDLTVRDNGRGIRDEELVSTRSFGLLGMSERAIMFGGNTVVEGIPGKGTTVRVRIPAEESWERL